MTFEPRFLYFISSHADLGQVRRLVGLLKSSNPGCVVVIHHDAKQAPVDPKPFAEFPDVHFFPNPEAVYWGDWSQVEAFLRVTRWCLQHFEFDWLVHLSGQDYPLRPLPEIEAEISGGDWQVMLEQYQPENYSQWSPAQGRHRYYMRYFPLPKFRYAHRLPAWANRALQRSFEVLLSLNGRQHFIQFVWRPHGLPQLFGLPRIKPLFNEHFKCYVGSQWGNFNRYSIECIHRYVDDHPEFCAYFRNTWIPDEAAIHTLVGNHPDINVLPENRRFINWYTEKKEYRPRVFRLEDFDRLIASGAHFGRKFDASVDTAILDALDQRVLGRSA